MAAEKTRELYGGVALGGLGTGSVELRADGSLEQWQIFNNWGNRDKLATWEHHDSYGLPDNLLLFNCVVGQQRTTRALLEQPPAGLRGVEAIEYRGEFPIAYLHYRDTQLPVDVSLEAFSPFIPHDSDNSGQPGAFFKLTVKNNASEPCQIAFAYAMHNPFGKTCSPFSKEGLYGIEITDAEAGTYARTISGMAAGFLADADSVTYSPNRDSASLYSTLNENGRLENSFVSSVSGAAESPSWSADHCAICLNTTLDPNREKEIVLLLSWFFPEHHENGTGVYVGHKYANWYEGAQDVLVYFRERFDYLVDRTRQWHDTIYFGSSPAWLKDMIGNAAYLLTKTSWWVEDGRFSMYESFHCPTIDPIHVRDAASSMVTMLFPELEKSIIRRFAQHQVANGKIPELFYAFQGKELTLQGLASEGESIGGGASVTYAAGRNLFDNETKYILQVYRDYLWTGDEAFLHELYLSAKKAGDYEASRDSDGDALPDGVYAQTSNDFMNLGYLPIFSTVLWLASLKALQKMAERVGDDAAAEHCASLFERARSATEEKLWNGEFYASCCDESGEKLNVCFVDQLYGQFFSHLLGLGRLLPAEHIKSAIDAIFRYNATDTRFGITNMVLPGWGRYITEDSRAGQGIQPSVTFTFLMLALYEGRSTQEVLDVMERMYDNFTTRMPGALWSTPDYLNADTGKPHRAFFGYYLRAAALWNMLWTVHGFSYDGVEKAVTIKPLDGQTNVAAPIVTPHCWGTFSLAADADGERLRISLAKGQLELAQLVLAFTLDKEPEVAVSVPATYEIEVEGDEIRIAFSPALVLEENATLELDVTRHPPRPATESTCTDPRRPVSRRPGN